jgi:hypothetical protein
MTVSEQAQARKTNAVSDHAPPTWSALLVRVVLFVGLLLVLDRVVGTVLRELHGRLRTGQSIGEINRALDVDADVLILGSSRAKHGFDDRALSEQLGVNVFNAGSRGLGLWYARALSALFDRQRPPRLVVFEVAYFEGERERIRQLAPFYGRSDVFDRILVEHDWRSRVKLLSQSYRFNGLVFSIAQNLARPRLAGWGFEPKRGVMSSATGSEPPAVASKGQVETWLEDTARRFVDETRARGSDVVFVECPTWKRRLPADALAAYERVAAAAGVPFLRFDLETAPYLAEPTYFVDTTHLNENGAGVLSRLVGEELQRRGLIERLKPKSERRAER